MRDTVGKVILIFYGLTLGFVVYPSSSFADSLWKYEGSTVRLVTDGHERRFLFERPSPLLKEAGVEQGMVLFEGTRVGSKYMGKARSFFKNCLGPVMYDVSGDEFRETEIVLQGRRAVYDETCRPTGHFVHQHLRFKYLESIRETELELLSEEQGLKTLR